MPADFFFLVSNAAIFGESGNPEFIAALPDDKVAC
jgi:hypothetical protein